MATKAKELTERQKRERGLLNEEATTATPKEVKPAPIGRAESARDYLRRKAGWPPLKRKTVNG